MTRLTLANLDDVARRAEERHARWKSMLMVCAGTGCVSAKSLPLRDAFRRELERRGMQDEIQVVATGCNGFCAHGPICVVQPDGVFYERLKPEAVPALIESHFVKRQPLEEYLFHGVDEKTVPLEKDIEFFAKQQCIALRNRGKIDPEDIEDALRTGAYRALRDVLKNGTSGDELVKAADPLRAARPRRRRLPHRASSGRAASGPPASASWSRSSSATATRATPARSWTAASSRPTRTPSSRACCIGARALGATEGFVYIRHEYPLALAAAQPGHRRRRGSGACWARTSSAPA